MDQFIAEVLFNKGMIDPSLLMKITLATTWLAKTLAWLTSRGNASGFAFASKSTPSMKTDGMFPVFAWYLSATLLKFQKPGVVLPVGSVAICNNAYSH